MEIFLYISKIIICIFAVFGVVVFFRAAAKRLFYEPGARYAYPLIIPVDPDPDTLEYIVRSKRDAVERGYYTRLILLLPDERRDELAAICDRLRGDFSFVDYCGIDTLREHIPE